MAVELKVPQAGESVQEVQVREWRKSDGDWVDRDEIVAELETDKAAMELPSPTAGRLQIRKQAGEIAKVGEVLATIDEQAAKPEAAAERPPSPEAVPEEASKPEAASKPREPAKPQAAAAAPKIMPAARREMAQASMPRAEVTPTGPGGRILKEDVQRAEESLAPAEPQAAAAPPAGPREEETVPMSMLRRRVAHRLVEAQHTAAMLTTFNEADMSAVMSLRKSYNDSFEKKYGIKLGLMSFFVKASIDALKLFPQVNAEIRGNDIVYKNYYDIGVAVSTDRGLVVPVLRSAELMSFAQVEQSIAELARRARDGKLTIEELEGGTFTITNGGIFGSMLSTPILNPPQSGILGLHVVQDRPVARGGQVVIRPMMYLALTYDHRIVDGREAVSFLRRIKECIETPERILVEV